MYLFLRVVCVLLFYVSSVFLCSFHVVVCELVCVYFSYVCGECLLLCLFLLCDVGVCCVSLFIWFVFDCVCILWLLFKCV